MAHSSAPTLNADNRVTRSDDLELEAMFDTPLETLVDILLPDVDVEVGLLLGEEERIHATIEVGILVTSLILWLSRGRSSLNLRGKQLRYE